MGLKRTELRHVYLWGWGGQMNGGYLLAGPYKHVLSGLWAWRSKRPLLGLRTSWGGPFPLNSYALGQPKSLRPLGA